MKIFTLYILLSLFPSAVKPAANLRIEITNVRKGNGKIWIAIFKPNEKFGSNKPGIAKIINVTSVNDQSASFELEPGRYAVAMYHDLNGNDVMDKNFVGIPKEPYGFSKNFRPKFSAPTFEDCAFDLLPGGKTISVKLSN